MNHVSRETSLDINSYINIKNLWFKDVFPDADPWAVLIAKHKEAWLKNYIANENHHQLGGIELDATGLLQKDRVLEHPQGEKSIIKAGAIIASDGVVLMPGCLIEAGAYVAGPSVLGPKTTVRHAAYVRGGVITGEGCVIGHSTEVKSSIFANDAKAAHFAYVGDSVLGHAVNLGAGTKLSNLKIIAGNIKLKFEDKTVDTGLRKFGAILGDTSQTGCNTVLNPGVVLGKQSLVYPCVAVKKGLYKAKSFIK
ncbi:hypothetical protein MRY82_10560 [bacterium]|nr:hypothetical protein [bacterium]